MQGKIFNVVKDFGLTPIVINADDLSLNPKKVLKILCNKLNIPFMEKMLKWPKGKRTSDGIWGEIWYQNVQSSTKFIKLKKNNLLVPEKYKIIYEECMDIYNQLNTYNIINEK